MEEYDNVTYRRIHRSSSLNDVTKDSSALFDATMMSIPNTSLDSSQSGLNDKIKKLSDDLLIAHQEIENLNTENFRLKSDLQKYLKEIDTYKSLYNTDSKNGTPRTDQKRKQKLKIGKTPSSNSEHTMTSPPAHTANETTETFKTTRLFTTTPRCKKTNNIIDVQREETGSCTRNNMPHKTNSTQRAESANKTTHKISQTVITVHNKPKLCIISSNNVNNVLSLAENTFAKTQICHYLLPNRGIKNLFSNLTLKLADYSRDDHCIIFIGDEDFGQTNNYLDLTIYIREMLMTVQHTNVIICLPTYKNDPSTIMYNSRIETFNNLLYLDIYTHNYAILFDTNLDLVFDRSMFKHNGSINYFGMVNIFNNLKCYVSQTDNQEHNHNDSQIFFRE